MSLHLQSQLQFNQFNPHPHHSPWHPHPQLGWVRLDCIHKISWGVLVLSLWIDHFPKLSGFFSPENSAMMLYFLGGTDMYLQWSTTLTCHGSLEKKNLIRAEVNSWFQFWKILLSPLHQSILWTYGGNVIEWNIIAYRTWELWTARVNDKMHSASPSSSFRILRVIRISVLLIH